MWYKMLKISETLVAVVIFSSITFVTCGSSQETDDNGDEPTVAATTRAAVAATTTLTVADDCDGRLRKRKGKEVGSIWLLSITLMRGRNNMLCESI